VAGFISEWWPASNRKPGRLEIGSTGRIESEFALPVNDGTPAGSPTRKTFLMLTWLAGYQDGIGALGSVDSRFQAVGKMDLESLAAMVIAYCKAKPTLTVDQAVTGVFEMTINAMSGNRIDLALPQK
jgi:hypothetical protein